MFLSPLLQPLHRSCCAFHFVESRSTYLSYLSVYKSVYSLQGARPWHINLILFCVTALWDSAPARSGGCPFSRVLQLEMLAFLYPASPLFVTQHHLTQPSIKSSTLLLRAMHFSMLILLYPL